MLRFFFFPSPVAFAAGAFFPVAFLGGAFLGGAFSSAVG